MHAETNIGEEGVAEFKVDAGVDDMVFSTDVTNSDLLPLAMDLDLSLVSSNMSPQLRSDSMSIDLSN